MAALFLAVAILHVRESHFAMSDVLMTMFLTGSLACIVRGLGARSLFWFAAGGFTGGLATSTKYSAAVIVVAMGLAQLVLLFQSAPREQARPGRSAVSRLAPTLVFLAAFVTAFLLATPYSVLDYPAFSKDLRDDFAHLSAGHALNVNRGWAYHLTRSLPYGLGLGIFVVAIPGLVILLARPRHWAKRLVIGGFAAAFFVSMSRGHTVFFRYVLPLVPVLCLCAALCVRTLGDIIARRFQVSAAAATTTLGVALALWP